MRLEIQMVDDSGPKNSLITEYPWWRRGVRTVRSKVEKSQEISDSILVIDVCSM